jgi:hypothetical protein
MARDNVILTNFTAGELSPLLQGRVDISKYSNGCRRFENLIVLPHGGATKTPGTVFAGEVAHSAKKTVLIPFIYSFDESYMIEVGEYYFRFWKNHGLIESSPGVPYEVVTPYAEDDLAEIHFKQSADVMYLTHSLYPVQKLSRFTDNSWTLTPVMCEQKDKKYITGITKANPGVVTSSAHGYSNTDTIFISGIVGMVELSAMDSAVAAQGTITMSGTATAAQGKITSSVGVPSPGQTIHFGAERIVMVAVGNGNISLGYCEVGTTPAEVCANIIATVNGYAPTAALVTASAGGGTTVLITYKTVGTVGNSVAFTETCTNITCDGSGYLGGTTAGADIRTVGQTFVIDGYTFTWKLARAVAFEVTIGNTSVLDATNVISAVNADMTTVTAAVGSTTSKVLLTAVVAGVAGNSIITNEACTNMAMDGATLGTTRAGVDHSLAKGYFTVLNKATDTFQLAKGGAGTIDTSGFTAYVSGGEVERAISNITKADPGVVTCNSHGLLNGDIVYLYDISGMVELNGTTQVVANITTNTFEIEDTSAMTVYTTGGRFSEVLFSTTGDYPACVSFFEERLAFAATVNHPQTENLSVSGDYENFLEGDDADDAMEYTIKSTAQIKWLLEQDYLIVGTSDGVYRAGGASQDPLTPTNIVVRKQFPTPCSSVPPIPVGENILFAQRFGMKLREAAWDIKRDGYIDNDITILSEHITRGATLADSGIVGMAFTSEPIPIIWMILAGGSLIGCTYMKAQDVVGFHRHPKTNAIIESIASMPGDQSDELWMVVQRVINGFTVRYIEYMSPLDLGGLSDPFFVDCGLVWDGGETKNITNASQMYPVVITAASHGFDDGDKVRIEDVVGMTELNDRIFIVCDSASSTFGITDLEGDRINGSAFQAYLSGGTVEKVASVFSGLDHLEGESVSVCADGQDAGLKTVSGGSITLDGYYNSVSVGLPYVSVLQPVRVEMGNIMKTSQCQLKKIDSIAVRLFQSLGGTIGGAEDTQDTIPYVDPRIPYTGDIKIPFWAQEGTDGNILLEHTTPLPFTILAIVANGETFEGD